MRFVAEDVGSLSRALSVWEYAEYCFTALVVVACVGEYIADFTDWFTGGEKEHKEHLARVSTVILVAALALELTCLVKTNSLSGRVIGSLGDKAEHADKEARQAVNDSGIAEKQSVQATIDADKASGSSSAAQTASGTAMTLAQGARREADSFEKDIASAKTQAASAESHLADALNQAANATAELDRLKSARTLMHVPELISTLKAFKGTEYTFNAVCADNECITLLQQLDSVLQSAEWKRGSAVGGFPAIKVFGNDSYAVPQALTSGLRVSVESTESMEVLKAKPIADLPSSIRAAIALIETLYPNLDPPQQSQADSNLIHVDKGSSTVVRISVGRKQV